MDHWPDIDRCRRLKKAKYPQGKTMFNYVCVGQSWILDLTKKGDGLQRCAAPIISELIEAIKKLIAKNPPRKKPDDVTPWIDMKFTRDGTFYAAVPAYSESYFDEPYSNADTLPNALADLWLWLRGREK